MNAKLNQIHSAALEILDTIGIRLFHDDTLDLLNDKGVHVGKNGTALFTPDQVRRWISSAPASFELAAPDPVYDTIIGGDHTALVSGYGCAAVSEADGTRRNALLSDYIEIARLIHQSPLFSVTGGILAQPSDVPAHLSHLIMLYTAMIQSDKCLMGIPGNRQEMEALMELAAIRFDATEPFDNRPRLMTMISTISPLQMDEMALSSIHVAAERRQPLILSPAPAAGTTGPIDLAANLAMATAEALAGILVAQMISPGTPVVFGLQCYGANLKTGGISIGSPAYALQAKYCAALARRYNIPSRCGGCATDARIVSPRSGYESMMSMLTAMENQVNLIVHSAGILDSFGAFSYEQFFIDLDIIEMIRYYLADLEASDNTIDLDLIRSVGPGGQFLTSKDTMQKCRTHSFSSRIKVPDNVPPSDIRERTKENINTLRHRMVRDHIPPAIPEATLDAMDAFMVQQGVNSSLLKQIKEHP